MLYVLEQGPTEQTLLEMCLRERRPLPAVIQNAPELEVGLELYYGAYLDLQSHRPLGFDGAAGLIPHLVVREYALAYDFTEEQHEDLQFYVKKLDEEYLKWKAEQSKKRTRPSGNKGAHPAPRQRTRQ